MSEKSGPRREIAAVAAALLLPIPLLAASGLTLPLPGAVERGLASLLPGVGAEPTREAGPTSPDSNPASSSVEQNDETDASDGAGIEESPAGVVRDGGSTATPAAGTDEAGGDDSSDGDAPTGNEETPPDDGEPDLPGGTPDEGTTGDTSSEIVAGSDGPSVAVSADEGGLEVEAAGAGVSVGVEVGASNESVPAADIAVVLPPTIPLP